MKKGTFLSADNKTSVVYYIFEPKSTPRAVVQISHGMMDYILRYKDFIEFLNNKGIVVCGNDDLGHGFTSTDKSTDGYFAKKDGNIIVLKDLHTMTLIAKNKYKDVPFFLLGHSMGSFFARMYAYYFPNELSGLILCGTSGKVFGTGFGIILLQFIKAFKGDKSYCSTIENLMLSKYFKYIKDIKTKREWVTSDEEKLKEYEKDPRTSFRFTASAYQDMLKTLKFVNSNKWAKKINKKLPILLCSGAKDPVGNYGNGIAFVYKILENQQIEDLEMKLYSDARHELHNEREPIKQQFFNDVNSWINKRI